MPNIIPKVLPTTEFTPNEPPELKKYAMMIRKLYEQLARVLNQVIDIVNAGAAGLVTSVFGRTGAVVAVFGDYSFSLISGLIAPSQVLSASINRTAQAANVAATTLFSVGVSGAGLYLITVYMVVSQAATTSSTLPDSRITYTDKDSGAVITVPLTSGLATNTLATFTQGTLIVNAKASTDIQYDIGQVSAYASVGGTPMQFAYHARAEYLG